MLGRRAAVTGIGVVAPAGIGKDAFWSGLLSPAPPASADRGLDPSPYFDNPKEARRSDRVSQFTLAAAAEALEQAGEISPTCPTGTFVGTGVGGIGTLEEQIEVRLSKGERRVSRSRSDDDGQRLAATISMRYGWQGPCENTVTACAGYPCDRQCRRMVADGRRDVVMAGGAEAPFTPTAVAGFGNMTALSNSGDSRPFDANRDGFVMAEGAAILVLEAWELAEARAPRSLARCSAPPPPTPTTSRPCRRVGWAPSRACSWPWTTPASRPIRSGTSTRTARRPTRTTLPKPRPSPRCSAPTTRPVGHLHQGHHRPCARAAGALEAVAVLLAMQHGKVPPTAGLTERDPELPAINIVEGGPADWEPGPSLSNSLASVGTTAPWCSAQPDCTDPDASASAPPGRSSLSPRRRIRRRPAIRDG